jgi:hypothetical protein
MTAQTNTFSVSQRVQVVNLDADGQPAAYHGCTCRILGFLNSPEGQPAARVMFTGSVERKILLSKLQPIAAATPTYTTSPRSENARALPEWAGQGAAWTLGGELQVGDTIYFSHIANPRFLNKQLTLEHWQSTVLVEYHGFSKRIAGQLAEVDPTRWYVVKRAVRR